MLNRVALLNAYLGPEPEVESFVREQLITDKEEVRIREAIRNAGAGNGTLESIYGAYLLRTHLDVKKISSSKVGFEALVGAMFDLELGDRVKRLQLNRYSDVHEAREFIDDFVLKWRGGTTRSYATGSIWWDGVNRARTPHAHWISTNLAKDRDFHVVFRKWQDDCDSLQDWLDESEESQALGNNIESGYGLVFSVEAASRIMDLAKVRFTNSQRRRNLTFIPAAGKNPRRETKGGLLRKACLVPRRMRDPGPFRNKDAPISPTLFPRFF